MPKQVIVLMDDNYPFGECEECSSENTRVLVRKIYQLSLQQKDKLLEKVSILRKLKNQHMIKIESVLEEEQSIHFLFQYIPIKLQTWISNINDEFIMNFRDQIIKFSSFLANNYIKIEFQLKNIGMDQNYGAKYFLDLDFAVDPSVNKQKLKSNYIREITTIFKPYINLSFEQHQAPDSERERNSNQFNVMSNKNTPEVRKHDSSISPPTNKASTANKNKEKALEKYYQEVNMSVDSVNQKILQEFMDVLDNEEEEEIKANHTNHQQGKPSNNTSPNQFQKKQNQPNQPALNNDSYNQQSNNINSRPQNQQNQFQYQQNYYQEQPQNNQLERVQNQQNIQKQQNAYQKNQNQYQNSQNQYEFNDQNTPLRQGSATQSLGRGKNDANEQSEMWRESADLQNRVKNAIQKSMVVIKRFKAIKDNSLL